MRSNSSSSLRKMKRLQRSRSLKTMRIVTAQLKRARPIYLLKKKMNKLKCNKKKRLRMNRKTRKKSRRSQLKPK